jgi:hypothetical protein
MHSDKDGKGEVVLGDLNTNWRGSAYLELDDWPMVFHPISRSSTARHDVLYAVWPLDGPPNGSAGSHRFSAAEKDPRGEGHLIANPIAHHRAMNKGASP